MKDKKMSFPLGRWGTYIGEYKDKSYKSKWNFSFTPFILPQKKALILIEKTLNIRSIRIRTVEFALEEKKGY